MQGIFVGNNRPKSKREVRDAVSAGTSVRLEATSAFSNEYDGLVTEAPDGTYYFVGPDPYKDRRFYGTIVKRGDTIKVS